MPPPPPPPPGPPPPGPPPPRPPPPGPSASKGTPAKPAGGADRSLLLSQIQKGTKLKKAVTNDRSAPIIEGKSRTVTGSASGGETSLGATSTPPTGGLGGLFAGGIPKLKSRGNAAPGKINEETYVARTLGSQSPSIQSLKSPTIPNSSSPTSVPLKPAIGLGAPSAIRPPLSLPPKVTDGLPPPPPPRGAPPLPPLGNSLRVDRQTLASAPSPRSSTFTPRKAPPRPPPTDLGRPASGNPGARIPPPPPVRHVDQRAPNSYSGANGGPAPTAQQSIHPPTREGRWTFHSHTEFPQPRALSEYL